MAEEFLSPIDMLLDENNTENLKLYNEENQEVEFEHLNGSSSQNKEDNDKQESKIDLNDVFSSGADDPTDYNYTELCEDELKYLDSLGVYWSDKLECWATKDIRLIIPFIKVFWSSVS